MKDVPNDAIHETWDSVAEKSLQLAEMIEQHCVDTGERFDHIILIPRGSYFPVNLIARRLGFLASDLLHACINSYIPGTTVRKPEFTMGQMPSDKELAGKDLLVIDEVCDTGYTLDYLTKWLATKNTGRVRTAVLHYKPGRSETGFVPDLLVTKTNDWIVYPWETIESDQANMHVKGAK
jgi:hypoxanthine phosphoribosyltransferase